MKHSLSAALEHVESFFMKRSPIHHAVRRIAETLTEMEIPPRSEDSARNDTNSRRCGEDAAATSA